MAMTTLSNLTSSDRILKLSVIDTKKPISSTGMVDPRLFKGDNNIHVTKDAQTNFWSFRYDEGKVPSALDCKFTNFTSAVKHAREYYKTRNISVEVLN